LGVSRSIIGRVDGFRDALTNNVVNRMDIDPGLTHNYVFAKAEVLGNHTDVGEGLPAALQSLQSRGVEVEMLELRDEEEELEMRGELEGKEEARGEVSKRQDTGNTVYISVNACRQPSPHGTTTDDPPQLVLYVSKTNKAPGWNSKDELVTPPISFQGGFANYTLNSTGDVYIGISAPDLPKNYEGNWFFEIAASIDGYYHQYHDTEFLYSVDTDSSSALFITHMLSPDDNSSAIDEEWLKLGTPFTMYAFSQNHQPVKGLEQSFCALRDLFNAAILPVSTGMTTRMTPDNSHKMTNQAKQQFHVEGLNASSTYTAYLAMIGNGTTEGPSVPDGKVVGGGGQVWKAVNFKTKTGMSIPIPNPHTLTYKTSQTATAK
jgi:calcium channel MID1